MALGGGTYVTQNKILPGSYFRFLSNAAASSTLSDRGVAAIGYEGSYGVDGDIFTVNAADFQKNSMSIFGYSYADPALVQVREIFKHASKVYFYKLTSGGAKATCTYADAKFTGTRGNDYQVVIQANVDDEAKFDVSLFLDTTKVFSQSAVATAADLTANDYVDWKSAATLTVTAGTKLAGGTDGTADASSHQAFLDKLEAYPDVNAVGYAGDDAAIKALYTAFAKRLREDVGIKLQAVVFNLAADYEGAVNVKNQADLVAWATGVIAGTAVNASATNMKYDGELTINTAYTQSELEAAIKAGEWVLHQVGTEVHVLEDLNSLTTVTDTKGDLFKDNQTIRVIDNIATSIATVFASKYLGKIPNNNSGRVSLWSDIVKIHQNLNDINAIEDFDSANVTVAQGDTKKSVLVNSAITVVNTMVKLYMETVIE